MSNADDVIREFESEGFHVNTRPEKPNEFILKKRITVPRWGWFRPPRWKIFKWAYKEKTITYRNCKVSAVNKIEPEYVPITIHYDAEGNKKSEPIPTMDEAVTEIKMKIMELGKSNKNGRTYTIDSVYGLKEGHNNAEVSESTPK